MHILFRFLILRASYFQSYVDYVRPEITLIFIYNAMQFLYLRCSKGCRKITAQNAHRSPVHYNLYYHLSMADSSVKLILHGKYN